eukprot:Sro233_g094270.2  (422) ;mRNA; r:70364-72749
MATGQGKENNENMKTVPDNTPCAVSIQRHHHQQQSHKAAAVAALQQQEYARQVLMQQPVVGQPIDPWAFHQQQQLAMAYQYHSLNNNDAYGYHQYTYQHAHHGRVLTGYPSPAGATTTMEHLPPGIPGLGGSTDPLESLLGLFPCVKLEGLPFDVSLEDILGLFQGLVVLDVLIVGQGVAFVLFANLMDHQMGLQRDRQSVGRRYVEITQATRADYYEAIAAHLKEQQPQSMKDGGSRRGESGPMSSDSNMWGGTTSGLSSVNFLHGRERDQLQGGADSMGGHRGLGMMPGMGMGSGGVERGIGSGVGGRSGPQLSMKRTGGGIQIGEHTGFLRMRGLPFSSTKDDIFKFFDGYNPVPDSIVLTYRSDGRATGEAYVGFISPDDSKKAMELHRKSMGTRYIELFISNKDEHGRAIQRFGNR